MKKKILISAGTLALAIVLGVSAYFLFFFEDKLLTAVENGDSETAVTLYTEKIADNQRKVEKYKEIFSEQLEILWDDFQSTKIDFETAEKQAKVIKDIGILPKADEVYDNIIQLNNSRAALTAGNRAAEQGDYKTAVLEYKKVTKKNDQFQSKMDAAVEGYKSQFNTDFDNALNNNDYETARNLYIELKEILPDDTNLCKSQEEKISNLILRKIEEKDIENGINLFQTLGEFITDKTTYKFYGDMLSEAKAWDDYAKTKEKAKTFMVGKWERADGGSLDGMIVECNGVEAGATGTVCFVPETEDRFQVGDSKWSSMRVEDENTISFSDMVKARGVWPNSIKTSYYGATIKMDRTNNTINIVYDVIDGNSSGQTQTWRKVQ